MSDPEDVDQAQYEDEYDHYNYDQVKYLLLSTKLRDHHNQGKAMNSGHSGKQRTKKEAEMNTNRHNPGGHERKITTKLINMEKNIKTGESAKNKS